MSLSKEESLTRVKGSKGFPCRALLLIKDKYNLSDDNVDHVVFYEKPFRGWASRIFRSLSMPKRAFKLLNNQLKQFWNGPISVAKEIRSIIPIAENKLLYAPHHLSHVLSAMPFVPKNLENEVQLHLFLMELVMTTVIVYTGRREQKRITVFTKVSEFLRSFLFCSYRFLRFPDK